MTFRVSPPYCWRAAWRACHSWSVVTRTNVRWGGAGDPASQELAGIDGVSGERVTLGTGLGGLPDDLVDGPGSEALGSASAPTSKPYRRG
jgi:hypothetical protein